MAPWVRRAPLEAPLSPHDRKLLFVESFFGNFLFSVCMLFGVSLTSALAAGVIMAALPGVVALTWAGWTYASESFAIREHTFNADPLPLYPFKAIIPFAGATVLLQGLAEILRCLVCLQTGAWTPRLKDAEEADVVEQQLAGSEFVDAESRQIAIQAAKTMEQDATAQRLGGGKS